MEGELKNCIFFEKLEAARIGTIYEHIVRKEIKMTNELR